jgi:hypothetical protein
VNERTVCGLKPQTFRARLEQMQDDMLVMANELNKSRNYDAAMRVQQVLIGIENIFGADDLDLDDHIDWTWPPEGLLPTEVEA